MSAFRQASDLNEAHGILERQIGSCSPVSFMATRPGSHASAPQIWGGAAFAVAVMIPGRQGCESERRSLRIAIFRCDAVGPHSFAFLRQPLLRPLESREKISFPLFE